MLIAMIIRTRLGFPTAFIFCLMCSNSFSQAIEEQTVQAAGIVLNEALSSPLNRIPQAMLADCHGVAIVPNVIKGGFIVGARHGKGILFVREPSGVWHAPVFITLTGGNIGWQVGVQSSDIVLVFKTAKSVNGILNGKLTIGGDAAAAAGPVGRGAAVATDGNLNAEIYTYSRSRGLFAGVSIDGSVVRVDQLSTGAYYPSPAPGQPVVIPPSALQLTQQIASHASVQANQPQSGSEPKYAQQIGAGESEIIWAQILQLAPELFELLDDQWRGYLALPLVPTGGGFPEPAAVGNSLRNYDLVATDPKFAELAARPEFRSIHGLLKHYEDSLAPSAPQMRLPPPPQ